MPADRATVMAHAFAQDLIAGYDPAGVVTVLDSYRRFLTVLREDLAAHAPTGVRVDANLSLAADIIAAAAAELTDNGPWQTRAEAVAVAEHMADLRQAEPKFGVTFAQWVAGPDAPVVAA